MKIIHNNYFLTSEFFNDAFIHGKYEVYDVRQIFEPYFKTSNSYINLIYEMLFIIPILIRKRKENDDMLLFGIESIYELYQIIKVYPSKKIIVWLWNPIANRVYMRIFLKICKLINIKVYTFDKLDACKYRIKYHPQIINKRILPEKKYHEKYKLFFVGVDKKRYTLLKEIEQCVRGHYENKLILIPDKTSEKTADKIYRKDNINYSQYIELLNDSEVIIELAQPDQSGLTLRVLEAAFLSKRIITNNKQVMNYNLFNKDDIFLLDERYDENQLRQFIHCPRKTKAESALNLTHHNLDSFLEYMSKEF